MIKPKNQLPKPVPDPEADICLFFGFCINIINQTACLNDILPVPSAENISVWVWNKLVELLKSDHYHLYEVEVWETRTSGCVYRGE